MPRHCGAGSGCAGDDCSSQTRYRLARRTLHFTEDGLNLGGWPSCHANNSAHLGQQREWLRRARDPTRRNGMQRYFLDVYEQPNIDVDASKLRFFWSDVPTLGLDDLPPIWWACDTGIFQDGALWAPAQDVFREPCGNHNFPGFFVFRDLAPDEYNVRLEGVQDDHWVEVMRIARTEDKNRENDVSAVGQMWFWVAPGSGIWVNVGRSLRQLGDDYRWGRSSCFEARNQGFDSVQTSVFFPKMRMELMMCAPANMTHDLATQTWERACPPAHIELRAGMPSPRYAPGLPSTTSSETSRSCACDPRAWHINCLRSQPPWPPWPPQPPLSPSPPPDPPLSPSPPPAPPPPPPPPLPELANGGLDCWDQCGATQGLCTTGYCGTRGACCRLNFHDSPSECGLGCDSIHCCTLALESRPPPALPPAAPPPLLPPLAPSPLSLRRPRRDIRRRCRPHLHLRRACRQRHRRARRRAHRRRKPPPHR